MWKPFYIQNNEFLYICGRLNLNKNNEKIICGNHYQMKNLTNEAVYIQNQEFLGKWYLDGLLLTQRREINEKFDEVCTQNLLTKSVPVNVATIIIEE